jgi:hypothetical protein
MKISLAYAGMIKSEGQLLHAYFKVQNDRVVDIENAQVFAEPLANCDVGDVFEFKCSPNGDRVHKPGKRLNILLPQELVTSWLAIHRATVGSEKAWSKPLDPILEVLHPVRLAYHKLPEEESRALLIAQVVRFIVDSKG